MVNSTIIQGRMVRDAELRRTQSGTAVASFTVAWSEKYGDNERKLFLPCVAWKGTAEMASKWFGKGQEVVVEGKLTSRKWEDKNGNNRETIEMVVERMHFCGPKRDDAYTHTDTHAHAGEWEDISEEGGPLPF